MKTRTLDKSKPIFLMGNKLKHPHHGIHMMVTYFEARKSVYQSTLALVGDRIFWSRMKTNVAKICGCNLSYAYYN